MTALKEFSSVRSWKEFLSEWEKIEKEYAVVGLLYHGAEFIPFSKEHRKEWEEFCERLTFYINQVKHPKIGRLAAQLVVKKFLDYFKGLIWNAETNRDKANEVLELICLFLKEESFRVLLQQIPYTRFIQNFLEKITFESDDYQDITGNALNLSCLVEPILVWGVPQFLLRLRKHVDPVFIRTLLEEYCVKERARVPLIEIFEGALREAKVYNDLQISGYRREIYRNAELTLSYFMEYERL